MSKNISKGTATFRSYVIGYILSLYLTFTAYLYVTNHLSTKWTLIVLISFLAFAQFIIQLLFFMHLGRENSPRVRLLVLGLMIGVVFILVAGSIWIMSNLNYRMTPQQMQNYVKSQEDGGI